MPGWGGGKCPTTVPAIIFRPEASLVLDGRRCLTPSGPSVEPFSAVCLLLTGHRGRVSFADEGTETGDRQSWAWVPAVRWGLGSAPTRTRVSRPNSWPLLCCHRLKPRVPFTERGLGASNQGRTCYASLPSPLRGAGGLTEVPEPYRVRQQLRAEWEWRSAST